MLPDMKTQWSDAGGDGEDLDAKIERYEQLRVELELSVRWSIAGTDFDSKHDFQRAEWLEYWCYDDMDHQNGVRVSVETLSTWRDLYVASNECVERLDGVNPSRFVEGFTWSADERILTLRIGT